MLIRFDAFLYDPNILLTSIQNEIWATKLALSTQLF